MLGLLRIGPYFDNAQNYTQWTKKKYLQKSAVCELICLNSLAFRDNEDRI